MELRPWMISVLSTSYDLKEYRKAVVDELKSKNIAISAFEQPDFPVEPDKHSHDSCLVALDRADIAILIIDKRSGGVYYDSETKQTITNKEFLTAVEKGIPVYVFVKQATWDERHAYKTAFKRYENSFPKDEKPDEEKLKKDFDKTYVCTYVSDVSVIDFIEEIQHIYPEFGISNWIDQFDSIDELIEKVVGKLKGYSRKIVEGLVFNQRDTVQNKHTSTAFGMTLGDIFKSEYYIEPPFSVESGTLDSKTATLNDNIYKAISSDHSVLVYGEAGYGKTTILAKCFLQHVELYSTSPGYDIPIFLSLRNKGSDYHFDVEQFINEELATTSDTSLNHAPYPYLDISNIRTRFYCDGFDEIAEKLSLDDLERINLSSIFSRPLLLTCRQQFAGRYLKELSFADKFGIRIHIDSWNIDTAQKYIENYSQKGGITEEVKNDIFNSLDGNDSLKEVLDCPLLITMFLCYIRRIRGSISTISVVNLFKTWIEDLAIRERGKSIHQQVDVDKIVAIWEHAAWKIYSHKLIGQSTALRIDDLIKSLEIKFPECQSLITPEWFGSLFDCNNDCIMGTFHEQFMEFLVAQVLIKACINKEEPYPDFLKFVIRPEINRYFRGIWLESNENNKDCVFGALNEQYKDNLGVDSQAAVSSRVHAIYHIARLEASNRDECIDKAFALETHISVKLSLYFGAIKIGRLDREEEFYNLLSSDDQYNTANRGYHLAYYSDAIMSGQLPFEDDASSNWTGTLKAFERHFLSDDLGHYYLRRIDLVTMRQLIEVRNCASPLTEELLDKLGKQIENSKFVKQPQHQDFNNKLKEEYSKLKEVFLSKNK